MRHCIPRILTPLLVFALLGAAAMDEGAREIAGTIEQLRTALRALPAGQPAADRTQVIEVVRTTVLPHVDVAMAGRLVMGHFWRDATPSQREAFIDTYREMLLRLYGAQALDYLDAKIEFMPSQPSADGQRLRVRTRVERAGKPELTVDYQMHRNGERWQTFDVVVNGVSGVITLRQSVGEDLGRYGVDGVIARLRAKLDGTAARVD